MNNKEEINLYIEERQDTLIWMQDEVQLEILEEVVTFILNDIKQKFQTDILTLRDEENQYYEIDQIVEFKRPHTYITIPQRHDVKTLAMVSVFNNNFRILQDKIVVSITFLTKKFLQKNLKEQERLKALIMPSQSLKKPIKNIQTLQKVFLMTQYTQMIVPQLAMFKLSVIQPKKRNSVTQESQQPIQQQQNQPESPKFGQQPKEVASPSWISKRALNESIKKCELKQLTLEDVSKHNTSDSAWIVINSKVYDVTHYLNKHPGGKEQLMRGVGNDGTPLFMQHHPWVNAHYLLEHSQVGFLINHK